MKDKDRNKILELKVLMFDELYLALGEDIQDYVDEDSYIEFKELLKEE